MIKQIRKFSATWCAPCKVYAPILKEFVKENNIPLIEYDADKDRQYMIENSIRGVPTTIFEYEDGSEIRKVGSLTREELLKLV